VGRFRTILAVHARLARFDRLRFPSFVVLNRKSSASSFDNPDGISLGEVSRFEPNMKHHRFAFASGCSIVMAIAAFSYAEAQLPNDVPTSAVPPGTPVPGGSKLDLKKVRKGGTPFASSTGPATPEAARAAVPPGGEIEVRGEFDGRASSRRLPVELFAPAARPSFGYVHEYGSFQISGNTATGMFMLAAPKPFSPNGGSVDFYFARLEYVGEYTERGIHGFVYSCRVDAPINDTRYFLFSDQNLNVRDPNADARRWVLYYNGRGDMTFSTQARFYKPSPQRPPGPGSVPR
jgi:hypothetical protein